MLRGLPTRDDRLQEDRPLILDERHQIHVVLASDDEDALAAVTLGVRVLQDSEQVASLDVEDDFFEPDAALRPELPKSVPKTGPAVIIPGSLGKPPPSATSPFIDPGASPRGPLHALSHDSPPMKALRPVVLRSRDSLARLARSRRSRHSSSSRATCRSTTRSQLVQRSSPRQRCWQSGSLRVARWRKIPSSRSAWSEGV